MALLTRMLRSLAGRSLAAARGKRLRALLEEGGRQRTAGNFAEALRAYQAAAELDPASCDICTDLGNLYRTLGDPGRAAAFYARAVEIDPRAVLAHFNLAQLRRAEGDPAGAVPHLERAHAAAPGRGEILRILVTTLIEIGEPERAADVAAAASAAEPALYDAWLAQGLAHQKLHRSQEALDCYDRALALRTDDAELYNNRAIALQDLGRLADALAGYDAALALNPEYTLAHFHRGLARLLGGDYARGWPDYETRLLGKHALRRVAGLPEWDGRPAQRVLVHGEQGLGDEIMFSSCLPDLMSISGPCVVTCAPKLTPLFARSFTSATVLSREDVDAVDAMAAAVDCEVQIGSLPLRFRRTLAEFPRHDGYLRADPQRVARWRERLAARGPALNIGLSWRGGTHKSRQPVRSLDLAHLAPVLRVPGTRFVSLQYTEDAQADIEAFSRATGIAIDHWPEAIADYDETAALVCALDLTVSVCTAVIHLSGALGRPVWIMAPYSPEWRYGHAGEAMPWYPAARIVRQPRYGDWDSVIAEMTARVDAAARAYGARIAVQSAGERLQRI